VNEKIGPHACDTRASEDGANNNLSQHHTPKSLNRKEAASFLSQLRPQGPWTLTAIEPDGATLTRTFDHLDKAGAFIAKHNGKRNLYYSLNPTRPGLTSKATKDDIVAAEYLHVDLDPHADETPDEAKQRYLDALEAFEPHATFVVDSGNGLQGGWKLPEALGPERYSDVEALSLAITLHLGGTAGTQNIDRILRLPGTINLPNKVKLKAGRTECPAALIKFNGACASLDDFDLDIKPQDAQKDDEDKLEKTIRDGGGKERGERSEAVFWVVCEMIRRGYLPKAIEATRWHLCPRSGSK
jgi:hypothetical protein